MPGSSAPRSRCTRCTSGWSAWRPAPRSTRRGSGRRWRCRLRTLLFLVGPVLLGALLAVMLPAKAWWVSTTGGSSSFEWDIVRAYAANADRLRFLWEGLGRPLGLVVPLALAGLVARARR